MHYLPDWYKEFMKEVAQRDSEHVPTKEETKRAKEWTKRINHVCKPCWELRYCPYGPLVEYFPVPPIERKEALEHQEFLKEGLKNGLYKGWRKELFEEEVKNFDVTEHPEKIPQEIQDATCNIFGHLCPVFFVNEPLTETIEMRRISREPTRGTMIRVVRRDGQICQECGELVREDEIEFDHIIPYARGGSSEESNIRLIHRKCNRSKGANLPNHVMSQED